MPLGMTECCLVLGTHSWSSSVSARMNFHDSWLKAIIDSRCARADFKRAGSWTGNRTRWMNAIASRKSDVLELLAAASGDRLRNGKGVSALG